MRQKIYIISLLAVIICIGLVYKAWFVHYVLAGADFGYYFRSYFSDQSLMPYAWSPYRNGVNTPFLWSHFIITVPTIILSKWVTLPWEIIERIVFFIPYLLISFFSIKKLFISVFERSPFMWLSPLIYMINSYILMIVGGGQLQIALAYALAPLVIALFIDFSNDYLKITDMKKYVKRLFIFSLVLSLQVMVDIRIAYLTVICIGIYWLLLSMRFYNEQKIRSFLSYSFLLLFIPLCVLGITHAYWILPTLLLGRNPVTDLGTAFSTTDAVTYFSFARLENTFSLLHPNWPENIFGKTYFMRWEFLFIPILVFSSLFFIKSKEKKGELLSVSILFFLLLALVGSFLAKGAQEPFGGVYLWSFLSIPGFSLFRDPTKFYLLIAISYSMLIPVVAENVFVLLKKFTSEKHKNLLALIVFLVIGFLITFPLHEAFKGTLGGTFKKTDLPQEYKTLDTLLTTDMHYGRVLYMPGVSKYSPYTTNHPPLIGKSVFSVTDISSLIKKVDEKNTNAILAKNAVRYIVIPYDMDQELFVEDRTYKPELRKNLTEKVANLTGLERVNGFTNMDVFKVIQSYDHAWLEGEGNVRSEMIDPTKYHVNFTNVKQGEKLLFSEQFDMGWEMNQNNTVLSSRDKDGINSFLISKDGSYEAMINYQPQGHVVIGLIVSVVGTILLLCIGGFMVAFS